MKAKLDALVSYSEGDFIIRPMAKCDVTPYTFALSDNPVRRKILREQMLSNLKHIREHEEDCNYIFSVLYGGRFYGVIQTSARNIIGTKANVLFNLPTAKEFEELNTIAVKAFISLCKETHVYDEELYIMCYEDGKQSAFVVDLMGSMN